MEHSHAHATPAVKTSPTFQDWIFILIVLLILSVVARLGHDAYLEALNTEISKKNGEELVAWLTSVGTERFKKDFDNAACVGGKAPAKPTATEANQGDENEANAEPIPGTWGACFQHMMTETEFKDMVNPFFKEMPKFIPACNPDDESVMGAVVLEKLIPTPPGSAVPVINSQLIDSDPIDQKLQLRLSVCDKGSYPVKIAEFEF